MKLQASRPISPKNLQSQTSSQTKNRLAISRLGILHGRLDTFEVRQDSDIAPAVDALKVRAQALYVCNDPLTVTNRTVAS
jgi:hypothetical protein